MKKTILFILSLLFGLMFIQAGLNKFFNFFPLPEDIPEDIMRDFAAIMEIIWLYPLIAVAEIIGGILVIVPKTRALGALVLFPVMVGILLTNFLVDTSGVAIALVMAIVLGWILYENRKKYSVLIG